MGDLGGFLAALSGGLTPQAQFAAQQARQQSQDLKTQQAAQALAGMFGSAGGAPQQGPAPGGMPPQPQPGMPMAAPRPPQPAPPPGAGPAPAAQPSPGMAAGAPAPAPQAMPAAPSAGSAGQPPPAAQGQPPEGFASDKAFTDVMQQTQGALSQISQKLAAEYQKQYGKAPDPATLLKATDLVIGQMKGLSPDISAAMRLNIQQAKIDQMGQALDEKAREADQKNAMAEQTLEENKQLKLQIAQLQASSRQSVANTNAQSRTQSAGIRAGAEVQSAGIRGAATTGAAQIRASAPGADKSQGYELRQAQTKLGSADRTLASLRANGGSDADIRAATAERAQAKQQLDALKFPPPAGGGGPSAMPKSGVAISKVAKNGKQIYSDDNGKTWYAKQ